MNRIQQLILLSLICISGLAIHGLFYLRGRPVDCDEAALALNIIEKSWVGLVGPLDAATSIPGAPYAVPMAGRFGGWEDNQICPVAFLWLGKAAIALFGLNARALQFVPFAAFSLFLIAAAWWLSRAAEAWTGAICLAILSLAAPLIEYSSEFKQYSFELLFSLLAVAAFYPDGNPVKLTTRKGVILAILGVISVWCSLTMIFVLGGVIIPLFYSAWRQRNRCQLAFLAAIGGAAVLSFGVEYVTFLHWAATSKSLYEFHDSAFGPLPPKSWQDLKWYFEALLSVFEAPLGFNFLSVEICTIAFILGVRRFWGRNPVLTASLLGPIALTLVAAQLHKYPWGAHFHSNAWDARLQIFLSLNFALFLAEGVATLLGALDGRSRIAAIVAGGCLAAPLLGYAVQEFKLFSPASAYSKNMSVEGVVGQIQQDASPYDCIYILQKNGHEFKFFSLLHHYHWEKELLVGKARLGDEDPVNHPQTWNGFGEDILKAIGRRRAWIVLGGGHLIGAREQYIDHLLDQEGKMVKRVSDRGAVGLLYDFSQPAAVSGLAR